MARHDAETAAPQHRFRGFFTDYVGADDTERARRVFNQHGVTTQDEFFKAEIAHEQFQLYAKRIIRNSKSTKLQRAQDKVRKCSTLSQADQVLQPFDIYVPVNMSTERALLVQSISERKERELETMSKEWAKIVSQDPGSLREVYFYNENLDEDFGKTQWNENVEEALQHRYFWKT